MGSASSSRSDRTRETASQSRMSTPPSLSSSTRRYQVPPSRTYSTSHRVQPCFSIAGAARRAVKSVIFSIGPPVASAVPPVFPAFHLYSRCSSCIPGVPPVSLVVLLLLPAVFPVGFQPSPGGFRTLPMIFSLPDNENALMRNTDVKKRADLRPTPSYPILTSSNIAQFFPLGKGKFVFF